MYTTLDASYCGFVLHQSDLVRKPRDGVLASNREVYIERETEYQNYKWILFAHTCYIRIIVNRWPFNINCK